MLSSEHIPADRIKTYIKHTVGMRDLLVRQTAVDELIAAQQAAVAGIGLRGKAAARVMGRARTTVLRKRREARWRWIVAHAKRTRVDPPMPDVEVGIPHDVPGGPKTGTVAPN